MFPLALPLLLLPLTLAHPYPPTRFPIPTNPPPSLCGTYPLPYCTGTNYTLADPSYRRDYLCGDSRLGPIRLSDLVLPLDSYFDIYSRFGTTNSPASTPPTTTNSSLPEDGEAGAGGDTRLCPNAFLTRWWNTTTSRFNYPPSDGFALDDGDVLIKGDVTLRVGVLLDRFGGEGGTFLSPAGAPFLQRALPPGNLGVREGEFPVFPYNYHVYRVTRPSLVRAGPIAPWFGQPGQGVQYETAENVTTLVALDFLKRVDPKELLREEGNVEGGEREDKGRGRGRGKGSRGGEEEDDEEEETFGEEEDGDTFEGFGGLEGFEGGEDEEGFEDFEEEDFETVEEFGDEGEGQEEEGSTSFENEEDTEPFNEEAGILNDEGGEIPDGDNGEVPGNEDGEAPDIGDGEVSEDGGVGTFGADGETEPAEGGVDEAPEDGGVGTLRADEETGPADGGVDEADEEGGAPELDVSDEPLGEETE